jgi:hypothetical protein
MREHSFFELLLLIIICLCFAFAGLYLLANFGRLFRGRIRNEWLRKNVSVLLIIFCLSSAMTPMNGSFIFMLQKEGLAWAIVGQFASALLNTLFVYNTARFVAEHKGKNMSFTQHKLLVLGSIIAMAAIINLPVYYILNGYKTNNLEYSL